MSILRLTVVFVTIASLLALIYYTVVELVNVWRAITTLSYLPVTAQSEQAAYMLLVDTIAFSILIILLLVAIVTVLHLSHRVL